MASSLSRRALLRGRVAGIAPAIRPPWALAEQVFTDLCNRGGECITVCGEKIIHKGDGGFPAIDFKRGECTFCGACVEACDSGALSSHAMHSSLSPWQLAPSIADNCLALNRVVCRSCAEQCEPQAIGFRPAPGGVSRPELDAAACNGCGACVAPCPVGAMALNPLPSSGLAGEPMQEIT